MKQTTLAIKRKQPPKEDLCKRPFKKPRQTYLCEFRTRGTGEAFSLSIVAWNIVRLCGTGSCGRLLGVNRTFRDVVYTLFGTYEGMDMPACSEETMGKIPPSLLWRWYDAHRESLLVVAPEEVPIASSAKLTKPMDRCLMYLQHAHRLGGTTRDPMFPEFRAADDARVCDVCLLREDEQDMSWEIMGSYVLFGACIPCIRKGMLDCVSCACDVKARHPLSAGFKNQGLVRCKMFDPVWCLGVVCKACTHRCKTCGGGPFCEQCIENGRCMDCQWCMSETDE